MGEIKHKDENINLWFFKKEDGPDCEMGENIGHHEPVGTDMAENEVVEADITDDLPYIFNNQQH